MHRLLVSGALLGAFAALAAAGLAGCFSNPDNPGGSDAGTVDSGGGDAPFVCAPYLVPAGTDLTTPTSFKNDVLPVFVNSCAFSGCHNDPAGNPNFFLGSKTDTTLNAQVYANIVSKPTRELPAMSYITPGDTSKSFLMRKLDNDQCLLDSQCNAVDGGDGGCLASMPQGLPLLDVPSRDIVRRWISQGAKDN